MLRNLTPVVFAASIFFGGCASDDKDDRKDNPDPIIPDATLTIENASDFSFIEINLSPVDVATWGPDLLEDDILAPGESLELSDIECDEYDIRVVDEDEDECILEQVDLCFDDNVWTIDNDFLAVCVDF